MQVTHWGKLDVCTNFIPDHVHSDSGVILLFNCFIFSDFFFVRFFDVQKTLVQIQLEKSKEIKGGKIRIVQIFKQNVVIRNHTTRFLRTQIVHIQSNLEFSV